MHFRFSKIPYFIGFFAVPVLGRSDFTSNDGVNLSNIAQDTSAIHSNQQTIYSRLNDFYTLFSQSSSSWGGHFVKTVGNAASKFVQEFGTNGWFPAVKASFSVIQADVGRIITALTDVNTHLELIEGHVDSIRDNTESIDTTLSSTKYLVENIDSNVDRIGTGVSTVSDNILLIKDYLNPEAIWADGGFSWAWGFTLNRLATEYSDTVHPSDFLDLSVSIDDTQVWSSRIEQYLQALTMLGSSDNEIFVNTLLRESIIQYTQIASTNLLQKILDTNDVWFAKIHDRIPTNLTVVVSNIASNASNDWHYTASTTLSSSPVLHDLSPDIFRDVSQSYSLTPPNLTGDFRNDVILLLAHAQQVAASSSSVNMDILTNLQVVANSILSSSAELENKKRELQSTISTIEGEYQTHQGDLDSTESSFKLVDNNNSAKSFLQKSQNVEAALSPLNVTETPDSYTMVVPVTFSRFIGNSASFGDYFNIRIDVSQIQGVCRTIRAAFGVFWWMLGFGILFGLLGKGVRLLAWISNFINPGSGNQILTSSGGKT